MSKVSYLLGAGLESRQVVVKSMILDNVSVNGSYSFNANPGYSSQESGDVIMFHDASAKKAEAIFYPFVPSVNPQLVINATIDGTLYTKTVSDGYNVFSYPSGIV